MNRLWRGVVAASVALSLSVACAPAAVADDEQFPDAALRACVARNLAEQRLAAAEYAKLTTLSCAVDPDGVITSLSGLDALAAVKSITLHGHNVTDFGPLSSLPTLLDLELDVSAESQIGSLAGFSLRELELHALGTRLPILPVLDARVVVLEGPQLTSFAGIAAVRMNVLSVRKVAVTDLSGLTGLSARQVFLSSVGALANLNGLAGLTQLQALSITAKSLVSVDELAGLTELKSLWIESPDLTDISVVTGFPRLQYLSLDTTEPISLGPTGSLPGLKTLSVYAPQLTSLEALRGNSVLTNVTVTNSEVSDISSLADLPDGARINLYGNRITDFSPLAGWTGTLSAHYQRITLPETLAEVPYPLGFKLRDTAGNDLLADSPDCGYADDHLNYGPAWAISIRASCLFRDAAPDQDARVSVQITQPVRAHAFESSVPQLTASPEVGVPLTATIGDWSPAPDQLTYQWIRDWAPIVGATELSYTPTLEDAGHWLWLEVTGRKKSYVRTLAKSEPALTRLAQLRATPTPTIQVDGPLDSTGKLTAIAGDWDEGVTLTYEWQRGPITVASGPTYSIRTEDVGASIRVAVTGRRPGYQPVTRYSTAISLPGPEVKLTPRITGAFCVGGRLEVVTTAPGGTTFQYRWYRNGKAVRNGTGPSYKLSTGDLGARFKVKFIATKPGNITVSGTSDSTIKIGKGTFGTKPVLLTGKPVVGRLLTGKTSKWEPGGQIAYSYQWYREWIPISKATKKTYRLKARDRGHNISLRVTARKKGFYKDTRSSEAVLIK